MDPNTNQNAGYSYLPPENQGQHPSNYSYDQNIQQGYPYLPPSQHPQYPPPSQYPQSQYYDPNFAMPGYVPPNQYGGQGYGEVHNEVSRPLRTAEVSDIDHRLDSGWYKCYVIWLYFLTFMAALDIIQTAVYMFIFAEVGGYLSSFICAIWMVYQSTLEISAIHKKDYTKANRALVAMVVYAVLNLAAVIILALWFANLETIHYRRYTDELEGYIFALTVLYSCCLFVHLFITIFGAVKVRRALKRRQDLLQPIGYIV